MKARTTVVVADAATIFRSAARSALAPDESFRVLEARNLDQLLEIASSQRVDIVLLDVDLPPQGGLAAASRLSRQFGVHPVLWCSDPEHEDVLAVIRAGAAGCLPKEISASGLVRALRKFLRGEAPLPRNLAQKLVEGVHALEHRRSLEDRLAVVSQREREVLTLLAAGLTNKQIAEKLAVSPATAKRHVQNVLAKLHLPSREAAASVYGPLVAGEEQPWRHGNPGTRPARRDERG